MSPQSPRELLEILRANLRRFDELPSTGHATDVPQTRQRLVKRIADVERIVQLVSAR